MTSACNIQVNTCYIQACVHVAKQMCVCWRVHVCTCRCQVGSYAVVESIFVESLYCRVVVLSSRCIVDTSDGTETDRARKSNRGEKETDRARMSNRDGKETERARKSNRDGKARARKSKQEQAIATAHESYTSKHKQGRARKSTGQHGPGRARKSKREHAGASKSTQKRRRNSILIVSVA